MSAEIIPYRPPTEIQRQGDMQDAAVERLGAWAQSAQAAYEVAEKLVQTSFVPEAFRNKPFEATAAILSGAEVGLSPLAALRSFDIINGTAAARAITLRAIVQSQGHDTVLIESTATRCKMKGKRRGSSEWQSVTWTMDRAKGLGLTNKHNWKAQPQAMLVARATSEICRLVASDAILGIGLSLEEIADGADPNLSLGVEPELEAPKTRRMSRKKSEPVAESEPEPAPISDAQSKKLHASFNDLGITERDQRMAYTIDVIGRDIESSNDLTKDEASQVIDRLATDLEQPFGDEEGE